MKTTNDLNALIPVIASLVLDNPEIGETWYGTCEEEYDCQYANNTIYYEENGWYIEVSYKCSGEWINAPGDYWTPPSAELRRAWGEVTDITASYYDEDTEEETVFSEDDLDELWQSLDEVLKDIA